VLAPAALRDEVRAELQSALDHYAKTEAAGSGW